MKNFGFLFLVVFFITLSSCSQNNKIMSSETIQRQWMLKTLAGLSYDQLVKAKAQIDLSNLETPKAFGGCNRIFFTAKREAGNSISFFNIGSTKMYCEDAMKVEDELVKALSLISKYELIAPHQIAFKDAGGKVIATAAAADWD
ncbi:MAG: hypothetical protein BGN92_02355 [Sphingobacteriales bacterium 41-5]|nr:MAG: hypothetical protein BGN92_02355 [Sphingobacteriales bacterium 41-5]